MCEPNGLRHEIAKLLFNIKYLYYKDMFKCNYILPGFKYNTSSKSFYNELSIMHHVLKYRVPLFHPIPRSSLQYSSRSIYISIQPLWTMGVNISCKVQLQDPEALIHMQLFILDLLTTTMSHCDQTNGRTTISRDRVGWSSGLMGFLIGKYMR